MADEVNRIEEQAFDAMLDETLGGLNPPDLSGVVLERFEANSPSPLSISIETATPERGPRVGRFAARRKIVASFAVVAALILWIFVGSPGLQTTEPNPDSSLDVPHIDRDQIALNVEPTIESGQDVPEPKEPTPRRGIPLLVKENPQSEQQDSMVVKEPTLIERPILAVDVLSNEINDSFIAYWKSVGVLPTPESTRQEISNRLRSRIDLSLPSEIVDDPQAMQELFATSNSASQIAPAWLRQITNNGVRRLAADDRKALDRELAQCIAGSHALDRTLLSWIEGQNPRSPAFHQAIGSIGKASTVNHLAKLTMGVDLRCVRCHDSKIEGSGKQSEYWEFAAMLKSQNYPNTTAAKDEAVRSHGSTAIFYELVDGRQKLAEPRVSPRWLGYSEQRSVRSVKEWADSLSGSKALAQGIVNSLWELVYGLPLRGRVVDPVTAPHDLILDSIQDRLATDLIDSKFNVARTLSIIIATPVARRSVPSVLTDVNKLVADPRARMEARQAVNAFAAATPVSRQLTLAGRLDQAERALGGKLDSMNTPFVAQADESKKERPGSTKRKELDSVHDDFPTTGNELPVQWLRLLPEQDSRVKHLAYLAGFDDLPEGVEAIRQLMTETSEEEQNLVLQRVWWLLQP